jgi:hypothetical protein
MKTARVISHRQVHGEVECNDGEFAEIQTVGIDDIEKDLLTERIQIHREDTKYSSAEFEEEFSVGSLLEISTTIEVTKLEILS